MNSTKVLELIDMIAADPGKIAKQAMVTSAMHHSLFKRVCDYAYNPFKTYGLRQIPERNVPMLGGGDVDNVFDEEVFAMLDNMIARRLTGNAARAAVEETLNILDEASADLLTRIIRKDLRAGFSESTINKALSGFIPEFAYQRCSLPKDTNLDAWPWEEGVPSQEKADGMYANGDYELSGDVSIRSRQGSEFPMEQFAGVVADIKARLVPGYQQHGEFVVLRNGEVLPRAESNGVMNRVLSGGAFAANEKPTYLIWDRIPLELCVSKGKCETPYRNRLTSLLLDLKKTPGTSISLIPTRIVKSKADAYAHAAELMKKGKEGTVIKHPHAIWRDGTSKEQIKLKLEFNVDLEIEGIVPGNAGTKNEGRAGSFACRTCDGLLKVDVTVKNEALRKRVDANHDEFIGQIIAVTANDITFPSESNSLHSLFLPRMSEPDYRKDKTSADTLERVLAQKQAAIFGESLLKEAA